LISKIFCNVSFIILLVGLNPLMLAGGSYWPVVMCRSYRSP